MEKVPIFDENHGQTTLEKFKIFDFFDLLFLEPGKAFFLSRILSNTFSGDILPILKIWKKSQFLTKIMD